LLWGESGGEMALWDLGRDRLVFRKKVHEGPVADVKFSPDGGMMASAGSDGLHVRRVARPEDLVISLPTQPGELDAPKPGEPAFVRPVGFACLAFTPDGSRIVGGSSYDTTLFIWRITDGRLLKTIPYAHGRPGTGSVRDPDVKVIAVTPDGRRIMSIGSTTKRVEETKLKIAPTKIPERREVRFWDIQTGQRVADYRGDEECGAGHGALSRDARHVAVADVTWLRIFDAATGQPERTIELPGSGLAGLPAFSPDGTLVATPNEIAIELFEVSTGRRLHDDPSTQAKYVACAAWSPAGDRIVTGHSDGSVRVWDATGGTLLWHTLVAPPIDPVVRNPWTNSVGFSPDSKLVFASAWRMDWITHEVGFIVFYEAGTGRTVREIRRKEQSLGLAALAPDGRMLVVGSAGNRGATQFLGIELETGRTRWSNPPEDQTDGFHPVVGMQFISRSPFFQAALEDGNVIRLNGLTGHEQRRFLADWRTQQQKTAGRPSEPKMQEATFSPDGRTLVSSRNEWLYVWDVESGTMLRQIRRQYPHGCSVALAPDGRTLATSDINLAGDPGEDTIRILDIESGQQVLALEPDAGQARVMAFSPDSKRLFTASVRSGIIWDIRPGRGDARAVR
jgi:WD40 repeat protein